MRACWSFVAIAAFALPQLAPGIAAAPAAAAPAPAAAPGVAPADHLPTIVFITTGGTIASIPDANGKLVPAANGAQLVAAVTGLDQVAKVGGIIAAAEIDSSDATPDFWIAVAFAVKEQLADPSVDGVVVTHGSDTLEQTAWFLQCVDGVGNAGKPVVVTGSMRGANSASPDGPLNMLAAAIVATQARAASYGVLVRDSSHASRKNLHAAGALHAAC